MTKWNSTDLRRLAAVCLLALAMVALAACEDDATPTTVATQAATQTPTAEGTQPSAGLADTSWTLATLAGSPPVADTTVLLHFGEDGRASGSDGCNGFSTDYTSDATNVAITIPAASTLIACPDDITTQANAFMTMLGAVTTYAITEGELALQTEGQPVATFTAAPTGLAGTHWTLTALGVTPPVAGTTVTLQFGTDGHASGSDGCNVYGVAFTERADSLTFPGPAISTQIACAPEIMSQATAYIAALEVTTNFTSDGTKLTLGDGSQTLATFAVASQELAGSSWTVTGFNNGREAVVSVIAGTEITAIFGEDGELTGSAGCNAYFAGVSATGGSIAIEPPGSTRMACAEPEGIMEQEAEYLAALATASTYTIQGDQLEMRTAEDAIAVTLTRN